MELFDFLVHRLQQPLPGLAAHRLLFPGEMATISRIADPPADARRSAVLVPLIRTNDVWPAVLFTVRSEQLKNHTGQISFPGGRLDADEEPRDAALREFSEEVGIAPGNVHVLGELSQIYIPPSNSAVTPIVGVIDHVSHWPISEAEVQEVIEVPLSHFLDPSTRSMFRREVLSRQMDVPSWNIHPRIPLWGATAMILSELVELTREFAPEFHQ